MHKIITRKYIKDVVMTDIKNVDKVEIQKLLDAKGINYVKEVNKESLIELIYLYKIDMWYVYKFFKNTYFGIEYSNLKKLLKLTDRDLEGLINEDVIEKVYTKNNQVYYSLESVYEITWEKLEILKSRLAEEKQICKKNKFIKSINGRILHLEGCYYDWNSYVHCGDCYILGIKTTGRNLASDEIISLSIIDMNGEVIFDEIFKSTKRISVTKYEKEGLTREEIEKRPLFEECVSKIEMILKDRRVFSYDAEFNKAMMASYGYRENADFVSLMEKYMKYIQRRYVVRAQKAFNMEKINQSEIRSSLGRCYDCLEFIKCIANDCENKISELRDDLK